MGASLSSLECFSRPSQHLASAECGTHLMCCVCCRCAGRKMGYVLDLGAGWELLYSYYPPKRAFDAEKAHVAPSHKWQTSLAGAPGLFAIADLEVHSKTWYCYCLASCMTTESEQKGKSNPTSPSIAEPPLRKCEINRGRVQMSTKSTRPTRAAPFAYCDRTGGSPVVKPTGEWHDGRR